MHLARYIKIILLITLLSLVFGSGVNAKPASGVQNLVATPHQGETLFNPLMHQGKIDVSTIDMSGYTLGPKGVGKWPSTAKEMDEFLGIHGKKIPDGPTTPGRDKTVWKPNKDTKITLEQHPYHPNAPAWHKNRHWHLDTPNNRHQRFLPGDNHPGY